MQLLVSTTGSETLTNKSVNLANNTLTGTFAQFNTAVSNATLVSTTGTETLTNKSLTASSSYRIFCFCRKHNF